MFVHLQSTIQQLITLLNLILVPTMPGLALLNLSSEIRDRIFGVYTAAYNAPQFSLSGPYRVS